MSSHPSPSPIGFRSSIADFARRREAAADRGLVAALEAEANHRKPEVSREIQSEYDFSRRVLVGEGNSGRAFRVARLASNRGAPTAILKLAHPGRTPVVRTPDGREVPLESLEAFLSAHVSNRLQRVPFFMRIYDAAYLGWDPTQPGSSQKTSVVLAEELVPAAYATTASPYAMAACVATALDISKSVMGFMHRDLHHNNVMARPCPPWVRGVVYRARDGTVRYFAAPDRLPVVIDYGYSTLDGLPAEMTKLGSWAQEAMNPMRVKNVNLGRDDFDRWIKTVASVNPTPAWQQVARDVDANAPDYANSAWNYGPLLNLLQARAPPPFRVADAANGRVYERSIETRDLLFVGYRAGEGGEFDDETREAAALAGGKYPPSRRVSWRRLQWKESAVVGAIGRGYDRDINAVYAAGALGTGASIPYAKPVYVAAAARINQYVLESLAKGVPISPPPLRAPPGVKLDEKEAPRFLTLAPHFTGPVVRPRYCAPVVLQPDPRYPPYQAWVLPPGARFAPAPDGSFLELPPFELCPRWNPEDPTRPVAPPDPIPLSAS